MSLSFSTLTPGNLELTPVRITYKGVDLGATLGNAVVHIEATKAPIKADQLGDSIIDNRVSGIKMSITTELAEIRLKDNWKVAFPWMNLVTSGGNKAGYFQDQIGRSDRDDAGVLILHPLAFPDANLAGDFKFYVAIPDGKSEITYSPSGQAKLKIVWNILPDFTSTPPRWAFYGDPAIGLTAASAGSPVFAGSGNGTMTGVSVFSGTTVSQTITVTEVTAAANGGVFNVNGSQSGALGLATVGVGFSSSQIAFTINDGSTDFVVGDSFTIAVTGANYS